jgi:hypothetical protein
MKFHPALSPALRALALAAALGVSAQAHADTLHSQAFTETEAGGWWASTPGGYLQFDNFALASHATVTSVSWLGVDLNELMDVTPINPTEFSISFYANDAGRPGALLGSYTIADSANATSTGQQLMGLTLFEYTATLSSGFQAQADTTYWIGISDPTYTNGSWFWAASLAQDNHHVAQVNGEFGSYAEDLAFSLHGTVSAVPEPSSAAMLLAGLLGAAALRRRHHRD